MNLDTSDGGLVTSRVLVFCDYYLPGYKGGGPIRSVSRIIENDDKRAYRVITRDRDLGDNERYRGVSGRTWSAVDKANVLYLQKNFWDLLWALHSVRDWRPDWYYFNSLFSLWGTLVPLLALKLRILPKASVMIAPRGELFPGALAIKGYKKRLAAPVVRWLVGPNAIWHASSEVEEEQIRKWMGLNRIGTEACVVAINPAPMPSNDDSAPPDDFTVLYASRIDRKKGLRIAVDLVRRVSQQSPLRFIVAGSVADDRYWEECAAAIGELPANVDVTIVGPYTHEESAELFRDASVLLLPTSGENFGHVIAEALSVGCPVIIPDTTPWSEFVGKDCGSVMRTEEDALCSLLELAAIDQRQRRTNRMSIRDAYSNWFMANQSEVNPLNMYESIKGEGL